MGRNARGDAQAGTTPPGTFDTPPTPGSEHTPTKILV